MKNVLQRWTIRGLGGTLDVSYTGGSRGRGDSSIGVDSKSFGDDPGISPADEAAVVPLVSLTLTTICLKPGMIAVGPKYLKYGMRLRMLSVRAELPCDDVPP